MRHGPVAPDLPSVVVELLAVVAERWGRAMMTRWGDFESDPPPFKQLADDADDDWEEAPEERWSPYAGMDQGYPNEQDPAYEEEVSDLDDDFGIDR